MSHETNRTHYESQLLLILINQLMMSLVTSKQPMKLHQQNGYDFLDVYISRKGMETLTLRNILANL